MNILQREWRNTSRSDTLTIIPLGDIHIGARACDEERFKAVVKRIASDKSCYWIGLGDYCDFINLKDPRFSPESLAKWLSIKSLGDLAKAQRDHFLEIVAPIAPRCLGLLCGNHETSIAKHFERDVYGEIVTRIKELAKMKPDDKLGLGYYGWLQLRTSARATVRGEAAPGNSSTLTINLHHGFVGGRLKGAKALEMERWLWSHNADICIFGHSHNSDIITATTEEIDRDGNLRMRTRYGCYGGTFLRTNVEDATTYSEVKGYYPVPIGGVEIVLRPRALLREDAIRIMTRG